MSKRRKERRLQAHVTRQCTDKAQFILATTASERAKELSKRTGSQLKHYRCPVCNLWHITGSTRPEELTEEELSAYRAFQQQQGAP